MHEDVLERIFSTGARTMCRIAVALALITWISAVVWIFAGLGGVAKSGAKLFTWHPLLAVTAVLLLLPLSVFSWRAEEGKDREKAEQIIGKGMRRWTGKKMFHAGINITVFVMLNVAVAIACASHIQQGFANFYSVHSWFGIITIALMKGNVFGGLITSCFESARRIKGVGLVHRKMGTLAAAAAFSTVILGLAEQQSFIIQKSGNAKSPTSVAAPILAVGCLIVGVLVVSILTKDKVKRVDEEFGNRHRIVEDISE